MNKLVLFALTALLAGCSGLSYQVTQLDSRFSEFDTYVAEGNRISTKSIAGGVHIDNRGVQINPSASFDKDGKLAALYISLLNVTDHSSMHGAPNSIGIPSAIEFLADDKRIRVPLASERRHSDTVTRSANDRSLSIGIAEYGIGEITPADFTTIVNSQSLVVRVSGSRQSHTYENADIAPSFRANMRSFYERFVMPSDSQSYAVEVQ